MRLFDRSSPEETILKLKEGDLGERVHAAKHLAKTRDASVVEALTAALEDDEFVSRRNSPVAPVREAAEHSLTKLGSVSVDSLLVALKRDPPDLRERAARCLGQIGDARAIDPLVAALGDSDSGVRQAVIGALGQIGKPAAESLRAAADGKDPASYEIGVLAEALASIGDPRAVDILTTLLATGDLSARKQAALALGKCEVKTTLDLTPTARPLMNAVKDDDADLRAYAEQALVTFRKTDPFLGQIFPVTVDPALFIPFGAGWLVRFAGETYPADPPGETAELEMSLVRFGESSDRSGEDIMHHLFQAKERLAELGLRAATLPELLSFGAAYPTIQLEHHIYAIGASSVDRHGADVVPYLWGIPATLLSAGVEGFGGAKANRSWQRFDQTPMGETRRYLLATNTMKEQIKEEFPSPGPRDPERSHYQPRKFQDSFTTDDWRTLQFAPFLVLGTVAKIDHPDHIGDAEMAACLEELTEAGAARYEDPLVREVLESVAQDRDGVLRAFGAEHRDAREWFANVMTVLESADAEHAKAFGQAMVEIGKKIAQASGEPSDNQQQALVAINNTFSQWGDPAFRARLGRA
jgi:HEAT repeat protein